MLNSVSRFGNLLASIRRTSIGLAIRFAPLTIAVNLLAFALVAPAQVTTFNSNGVNPACIYGIEDQECGSSYTIYLNSYDQYCQSIGATVAISTSYSFSVSDVSAPPPPFGCPAVLLYSENFNLHCMASGVSVANQQIGCIAAFLPGATPIPTASPTPSPSPTPSASPTPTPTATPTPTPPIISSLKSQCVQSNSAINIDRQSVNESIPLVGMPFSLVFSSDRFKAGFSFSPLGVGLGGWTPSILNRYSEGVLYFGSGGIYPVAGTSYANNEFYTTNPSGSEVYVFAENGIHLRTLDALTGATKFSFNYNPSGSLSSIADSFGNAVTFQYLASGVSLTSPYGQVSNLQFDGSGFLSSVTNPNSETYRVKNNSVGQMLTFTKPMGQTSQVTYDANGDVTSDQGAGGDSIHLVSSFNTLTGVLNVSSSTALGRTTDYLTSGTSSDSFHQTTNPDGSTSMSTDQTEGTDTSTDVYGGRYQATQAQDPRFGWLAPFDEVSSYVVPNSNINLQTQVTKKATLASSGDPFSVKVLTTQTELQNDPARVFQSEYVAQARALNLTSAVNRVAVETFNSGGQIQTMKVANLVPMNFTYDTNGRIQTIAQGSRISRFVYGPNGLLASSTDALGRVTMYSYDKANRLTQETLPDGNVIAMTYVFWLIPERT